MGLKAGSAAEQIFGGDAAGMNISRGTEGDRPRAAHGDKAFEDGEVAVAEVRAAVGDAHLIFEAFVRIEEAVGVNEIVGAAIVLRGAVDLAQHLQLEIVFKEGVEDLEADANFARGSAMDERRNLSEPLQNFSLLSGSFAASE